MYLYLIRVYVLVCIKQFFLNNFELNIIKFSEILVNYLFKPFNILQGNSHYLATS